MLRNPTQAQYHARKALPMADDWQHIANADDGSIVLTMALNGHYIDAAIDTDGNVRYSRTESAPAVVACDATASTERTEVSALNTLAMRHLIANEKARDEARARKVAAR